MAFEPHTNKFKSSKKLDKTKQEKNIQGINYSRGVLQRQVLEQAAQSGFQCPVPGGVSRLGWMGLWVT